MEEQNLGDIQKKSKVNLFLVFIAILLVISNAITAYYFLVIKKADVKIDSVENIKVEEKVQDEKSEKIEDNLLVDTKEIEKSKNDYIDPFTIQGIKDNIGVSVNGVEYSWDESQISALSVNDGDFLEFVYNDGDNKMIDYCKFAKLQLSDNYVCQIEWLNKAKEYDKKENYKIRIIYVNSDYDEDGLRDLDEINIYYTDPKLADTDGDGFSDKQEIDSGYDPLVNQNTDKEDILAEGEIEIKWQDLEEIEFDVIFKDKENLKLIIEDHEKSFNGMGEPLDYSGFMDNIEINKAGIVLNGIYAGSNYYIVSLERTIFRKYHDVLRIVSSDGEFVILEKYSNGISEIDGYFKKDENTIINNIELPKVIDIPDSYLKLEQLENQSYYIVSKAEEAEARVLYEYEEGKIYKDEGNCFYALTNDNVRKIYYIDLDFIKNKDGLYSGQIPKILDFKFLDGADNETEYTATIFGGCGPGGCMDYVSNINADSLEIKGKTSKGDNIYVKKDESGTLYWKDPFGDYLRFTDAKDMPMVECGKPVIYLYPEEEIDASVYVEPTGGFSITEPVYKNGWYIHATPESELYNYDDGEIYPYLFWEGFGMDYVRPKEGFVVERENVKQFLEEKLAKLGLIEKEYDEFIEFWLPKMQEKPYYFVTFVPQEEFDQMAPLKVVPAPDTIIRVFMDYEGLDYPIQVNEQNIITPERIGFTVVEWGGALHR